MATAIQNTGPAHLIDSNGFPTPPMGLVVSGHVLVEFTPREAASSGSYAYGVAIFVAGAGEYHKYVVWTLILKPDGQWIAESGNYVHSLAEAIEAFKARGGKV